MPNTRASTRRLAPKRKPREDTASVMSDDGLNNSIRHPHGDIEGDAGVSILENLTEARSGVEKLCTQIRSLELENESLRSELQQVQQRVHGGAGGSFGSRKKQVSRRQIQSLERTIAGLNAAREKDRHTIEKLREKEVQRDAKDLVDDHDGAVPTRQSADLGESAIKLLRSVCDTIDMNTLAEGEECAICMEGMAVGKCYSLPCRHPVCVECFEQLRDGSGTVFNHRTGSVQCPHCREISPREECETITHTAVQQWDLLLDISRQWASMDIAEIDIGEDDDDDKEGFIDDGSVATTESPYLTETPGGDADLDPEVSTASTSSNDTRPVAYKSLPSPLKRKRLSELVAQRAVKQRV